MGVLSSCVARPQSAGPWSIEPRVGVEADYTSNPLLHVTGIQAEEHVAATVDFPLRYDANELEFVLRPNARIANSPGYSSLASNYEHVDTSAQYSSALNAISFQGEAARDSSLYYIGGLVNGIGVPRDSVTASTDWSHVVSPLTRVQLDANWIRVSYDEPAEFNSLVDYRYWSAGPTLAVATSERNTLKVLANYGYYESTNGIADSKSENLQLGFARQLSEIWTLSTSAGYSHSVNREKIYFFGIFYLGTETVKQDGAVYSATLTRQGERFNFNAGASRSLLPTGLGYLSQQDGVNVGSSYTTSERWDFGFTATWSKARNPPQNAGAAVLNGSERSVQYFNTQFIANWHWTPQWIISMSAAHITQQYGPPTVSAGSTGVSISIARQFLRTQF